MGDQKLAIDQIDLDLSNPRFEPMADQPSALQAIIDDQDHKLANLAEDIVNKGSLNPMDRLLVVQSQDDRFIALEGNRRVAALRILSNCSVLTGLDVRPSLHKRFEELASKFDKKKIEPVSCFEVMTRDEGRPWIQLRHTGENEGRGIVDWAGEAAARFKGNDPTIQVLDFIRKNGNLSEDELKATRNRFSISNLERLIDNSTVRNLLGINIINEKVVTNLPTQEVIKPLKRIVLDIARKKIKVSDIYDDGKQTLYVQGFSGNDLPDLSKVGKATRSLDQLPPPKTTVAKVTRPVIRRQKNSARDTIVPMSCALNVTNNNTLEIYVELQKLKLAIHPNAIAVLLRVFIENSVDHYLSINSIPLKFTPKPGVRDQYKKLEAKVKETIAHLIAAGSDPNDFAGITRALATANHPLAIDLQHSYVHNRYVTPSQRDLVVAWDNAQVLFEKIWP